MVCLRGALLHWSSHWFRWFRWERVGIVIRIQWPDRIRFTRMRDVVCMMELMGNFVGEKRSQLGQPQASLVLLQ
jgi:hypothetical protein